MSEDTPPKALKLARPSFLTGALLILAGAIILRGFVPLEPIVIWAKRGAETRKGLRHDSIRTSRF